MVEVCPPEIKYWNPKPRAGPQSVTLFWNSAVENVIS